MNYCRSCEETTQHRTVHDEQNDVLVIECDTCGTLFRVLD